MRRHGDDLKLITFGRHTYSTDSRYSLEKMEPNDWQLMIQFANERDEGHYECQVSVHPPIALLVYLSVVGELCGAYSTVIGPFSSTCLRTLANDGDLVGFMRYVS